jgi:hypothetical protein
MPLTDVQGSQGYVTRLERIVTERTGGEYQTLQALGVSSHYHELAGNNTRAELADFLYGECGLHDQQVAI